MATPIGLKMLLENAQEINWPVLFIIGLIAAISFLIYAEPNPKDNKDANNAHRHAYLNKANKPNTASNAKYAKKANGMKNILHKDSLKNTNATANDIENAKVLQNMRPAQSSDDPDPSTRSYQASKISCYLVLDVEATCVLKKGYEWPNEIIVSGQCFIQSGSTYPRRSPAA
jgi:hypothetical protein